jgi:DNA polymerase I
MKLNGSSLSAGKLKRGGLMMADSNFSMSWVRKAGPIAFVCLKWLDISEKPRERYKKDLCKKSLSQGLSSVGVSDFSVVTFTFSKWTKQTAADALSILQDEFKHVHTVFYVEAGVKKAGKVLHSLNIKAVKIPDPVRLVEKTLSKLEFKTALRYITEPKADISRSRDYSWITDPNFFNDYNPSYVVLDTETTGLDYNDEAVFPFMAQLTSPGASEAFALPLVDFNTAIEYNPALVDAFIGWLNKGTFKIIGHNLKFDLHQLHKIGVRISDHTRLHDTQLMAWHVWENLQEFNLNYTVDCFVPEALGFNHEAEEGLDKSQMIVQPHEELLQYGCNDVVATGLLWLELDTRLKKKQSQYDLYLNYDIPAYWAVLYSIEMTGFPVDMNIREICRLKLELMIADTYLTLEEMLPQQLKEHLGDGLNFGSPKVMEEILYGETGFGFEIEKLTETGKPAVSAKARKYITHEWVTLYDEYTKLVKLRSAYLGTDCKFSSYIHEGVNGCWVRPSMGFTSTTTGRLASQNPNGQNIPARGKTADLCRSQFVAPDGYSFAELDISQVEVREIASVAEEEVMLEAYRTGKDLHTVTTVKIQQLAGDEITYEEFEEKLKNKCKDSDDKRKKGKASNLALQYKQSLGGFILYAREVLGITLDEEEASVYFDGYYRTYPNIQRYFIKQIEEAKKFKYVTHKLGGRRNLPTVDSSEGIYKSKAFRQAINSPIQGVCGYFMKRSLFLLCKKLESMGLLGTSKEVLTDKVLVCMTVHDSIFILCPTEKLEIIIPCVVECIQKPFKETSYHPPDLEFPVDVDISTCLAASPITEI